MVFIASSIASITMADTRPMTSIQMMVNVPASLGLAIPKPYADSGIANMLSQPVAVRIRLRLAGICSAVASRSTSRYPAWRISATAAMGSTSQAGAIG